MFTGIIEEIGQVKGFSRSAHGATLVVSAKEILEETKLGDSIAVDGCCQTVVALSGTDFTVEVSDETLKVTNFSELKSGKKVNLERALRLSDRLGGHIVSGHVDAVAEFIKKENQTEFWEFYFKIPQMILKYVVHKGSITLNGVSLTVAALDKDIVKVAIIPHTYSNTDFGDLKIGDKVNVEPDVLAKYVEKLLNTDKKTIDMNFLQKNGF